MRRAAIMTALLVGVALSHAQPAPDDVERAKQHYAAGQQAMTDGRFADAVVEYGAAYDITKDPVLFYKIGNANEKAGKCDVALIYYDRYLKEARPDPQFVALTEARIEACGGAAAKPPEPAPPAPPPTPPPPAVDPAPPPTEPVAPPTTVVKARHQGPWLLVGGSIAMLTIGAVLAYSAEASESDLEDLYVGLSGNPPVFDDRTRQRYDDLIAEGERYERLSWISFALAGGLAAGAAVWFYLSPSGSAIVTPAVTETSAGVQTTIRF